MIIILLNVLQYMHDQGILDPGLTVERALTLTEEQASELAALAIDRFTDTVPCPEDEDNHKPPRRV
jgi:hypothetical protein